MPRLGGYKSPGIPLFRISPQRHQLKCLFCCCTMIKLLKGSWCLRLCYGNPEVKPMRKPGLTVQVWVVLLWKASIPAQMVQEWLTELLLDGQTGKFLEHLISGKVCSITTFYIDVPTIKQAVMSAATSMQCCCIMKRKDHTTWVKQKNSKTSCTTGSSSAVYFFHCPFNHKYMQFSLKLVDGESHLIGPEITFFYNWLRVQTWEHKLRSQTEGH